MTTIIPFQINGNTSPPFSTIFTLDGSSVLGTAAWNTFGQRWYLSLTDQSGNNLWTGALVGSPLNANIYLAPDVFETSTILYRADTGNFEVTP
jgi:hypothetical protein